MLEKQLQQLIDQAPQYNVPTQVMERAIVPLLKEYASSLEKAEYYIPQSLQGNWLITVLESKQAPIKEKKVLYAFDNINLGLKFVSSSQNKLKLIPVTHLLFEMFACEELDSVIFLDSSSETTKEIERLSLFQAIKSKLKQISPPPTYC